MQVLIDAVRCDATVGWLVGWKCGFGVSVVRFDLASRARHVLFGAGRRQYACNGNECVYRQAGRRASKEGEEGASIEQLRSHALNGGMCVCVLVTGLQLADR